MLSIRRRRRQLAVRIACTEARGKRMNAERLRHVGRTIAGFQAAHWRDRHWARASRRDASEAVVRPVVAGRIRRTIAAREVVVVEVLAVAVERGRISPRVVEPNGDHAAEPQVREAEGSLTVALAERKVAALAEGE